MKIVQILPELNQGGVESIVLNLNCELIKLGHQSVVISAGGKRAQQIEQDGGLHIQLDVCSKNPLTFFFRVLKLRKLLRSLDPDILHAHSRIPAWLTLYANRTLHLPFVTTVHGFNSVNKYSEIMTKGDQVICVSNPVKDYILKNYAIDNKKVSVIHCGIDLTRFDPDRLDGKKLELLKSQFNLAEKKVITSIGRITELKDYETFIRAIALARKSDPNIVGLIIGHVRPDKQGYLNTLLHLTEELHLQNHIHFAEECDAMPELYTLSDFIVSCSKKPESFGLTLVESLAMNTFIIATRHGGPLDIITENKNGYFYEPRNVKELAHLFLSPSPSEKALRKDVKQRFSIGKMIDSTLGVYILSSNHD